MLLIRFLEAFSLPWEDDISMSPSSRDWEASSSGVADTGVAPMSEETLVKAACGSSQAKFARNPSSAKSLIRRGFFGPRVTSPSATDDKILASASGLIRRGFLGSSHAPPALPVVKGSTPHSNGDG